MLRQSLSKSLAFLTRPEVILFWILFLSFVLFVSGLTNANTMSRIGLTANLSQHARIDIRGYDKFTGDKAHYNGEYYSDKAPGMSFLAVPAAYLYTRFFPVDPNVDWSFSQPDSGRTKLEALIYISIVSTSALLTALASVLLFSYVKRLSASGVAGLVAAVTYALGTPTWGWAASFFGHATAGALLFIGFFLMDGLPGIRDLGTKTTIGRALAAGVALGAAVTVEFTSAVPVAIILAYYALLNLREKDVLSSLATTIAVGVAALLVQIPLFLYNAAAFGSPMHLGYSEVVGFDAMSTGYFGINAPKPEVLVKILVGFRRGVLWLSPVLVLAFLATAFGLKRGEDRLRSAMIAAVVGYYLIFNAGYAYWDGGWSTGPRHITPMYPFLALALGMWFAHMGPKWRAATLVILGISVLISLACVCVTMTSSESYSRPLFELILPTFIGGDLPQTVTQIVFGTRGLWQLLPLFAVWIGLGTLLWRQLSIRLSPPLRIAHR